MKEIDRGNPLHLRYLINMYDAEVKSAILEIYNQQSSFEKKHAITIHGNGRGFRVNHAKIGSEFAQMIKDNEDFSIKDMMNAREMILHYCNQLSEIFKEREEYQNKQIRKSQIDFVEVNLNKLSKSRFEIGFFFYF